MEQLLTARKEKGAQVRNQWRQMKLGDLCLIHGGNPSPVENEFSVEGVPFVKMKDLGAYHHTTSLSKTENRVSNELIKRKRLKVIKKGAILLPRSGSVALNHRGILAQDSVIVSHICALEVKEPSMLDNLYLYFYLTSINMVKITKKTTGLDAITFEDLAQIQIPIPSVPIQQKIAAILEEADALRHKDTSLIAKYSELLQTVFYDMFGEDFKAGGDTFFLSEVAEIVSGVAKNTNAVREDFVEVPYMRVANVQDGHINLGEIKTIKVSQSDFNKYLLKEDDILLTEGGDPDKLGRGAVWNGEVNPCIHQNHIFRVRITDNQLEPIFLSYLLSSRYGKAYFLRAAKQTTGIASINMTQLKNFKVIVPNAKRQKKFVEIVRNIERQRVQMTRQETYSENLFQVLVQRAFKGELLK